MIRARFEGPELEGLVVDQPAASVRLLVPDAGEDRLVMPGWNGNEFLRADGTRPIIRTFTPRRLEDRALTLEIVIHEGGAVSSWATDAAVGDPAAVSGTGRGYTIDPDATSFVLAGDESALPAMAQLLEHLPSGATVRVVAEIAVPEARLRMPDHPGASTEWVVRDPEAAPGAGLVAAVSSLDLDADTRVWAAGEAAAMFDMRRLLFEARGLDRRRATIRGYWKHARSGPGE